MKWTLGSLFLALALPVSAAQAPQQETVRSFPEAKCSLKLPGEGWAWSERQPPNAVAMAESQEGFVLVLICLKAPDGVRLDQKFLDGCAESYFQPGTLERRGVQAVTFKGLPCYQAEGMLADGRTTATMIFLAHGHMYQLGVIGTKDPVEKTAEFAQAIDGFAFTTPPGPFPEALSPEFEQSLGVSRLMGQIAFWCLFLGAALAFCKMLRPKKPKVAGK
jgi:hypothetical protein